MMSLSYTWMMIKSTSLGNSVCYIWNGLYIIIYFHFVDTLTYTNKWHLIWTRKFFMLHWLVPFLVNEIEIVIVLYLQICILSFVIEIIFVYDFRKDDVSKYACWPMNNCLVKVCKSTFSNSFNCISYRNLKTSQISISKN